MVSYKYIDEEKLSARRSEFSNGSLEKRSQHKWGSMLINDKINFVVISLCYFVYLLVRLNTTDL